MHRAGFWLFSSIGLVAVLSAAFGTEPEFDAGDRLAMLLSAIVGLAAAYWMHRLGRRAVCRYRCDSDAIQRESVRHFESIRWAQVDRIELVHPMRGSAELRVDLIDGTGGRSMSIQAEGLELGGRGLMAVLHDRLAPLFEAGAQRLLTGASRLGHRGLTDVVRIADDALHVEWPKGARQTIPLATLRWVEWLPGPLSGAAPGHVRVEHADGVLVLPQGIDNIHYLSYALQQVLKLEQLDSSRVDRKLELKVLRARERQTRHALGIAVGLILPLVMGALLIGVLVDRNYEARAEREGVRTEATVVRVERMGRDIDFEYTSPMGGRREACSRLRDHANGRYAVGSALEIRVLRGWTRRVWFEDEWRASDEMVLGIVVGITIMILFGLITLFVSTFRRGRDVLVFQRLEAELRAPRRSRYSLGERVP